MHRIDSPGAVAVIPTPDAVGGIVGYWFKGNPSLGQPATEMDQDWFNAIQEEIGGVIEYAGITLDKTQRTLLLQAIQKLAGEVPSSIQTSSSAASTIKSISVAEGETYAVEATVVARKTTGGDRGMAVVKGIFFRETGGNVTQQGVTQVTLNETSDSTWGDANGVIADLVVNVGTQSINLNVTGKASTTIKWVPHVRALKVS